MNHEATKHKLSPVARFFGMLSRAWDRITGGVNPIEQMGDNDAQRYREASTVVKSLNRRDLRAVKRKAKKQAQKRNRAK